MSKNKDLQEQFEAIQLQLRSLSKQLNDIKDILTVESQTLRLEEEYEKAIGRRRSVRFFYFGILVSLGAGLVSNFFVSLWFQKATLWTIWGLILSGLILFVICVALWYAAHLKYIVEEKRIIRELRRRVELEKQRAEKKEGEIETTSFKKEGGD